MRNVVTLSLPELETLILEHHNRTGEWPTRRELKVEKTLRTLKVVFPELIQRLGGPAAKVTTKQRGVTDQQRELLQHLPDIERSMLTAYFSGAKQQEIAEKYNMTQPGVSYRLGRALERLRFLEFYPFLSESVIETALVEFGFNTEEAKVLSIICGTTCQSSAAKALKWSQGKVRHHHWKAIDRLKSHLTQLHVASEHTAGGVDIPKTLSDILLSLELVRDNPAILHEYPSFAGRKQ